MSVQPGSDQGSRDRAGAPEAKRESPNLDQAFSELRGAFRKVVSAASEHAAAMVAEGLEVAEKVRVDLESRFDESLRMGNEATLAALKAGMTTKGATIEEELKLITPGLTALMIKAPEVYGSAGYNKAHELFAQGLADKNPDVQKEGRVLCLIACSDAGFDLSSLGSGPLSKVAGALAYNLGDSVTESKFRQKLVRAMAEGIIEGSHVVGTTIGGMLLSNEPKRS